MPPVKTETRAFCEKLLELNRIFTREDINAISSRVDRDVWKYKGGWYTNPETGVTTPFCRHEWVQQITIKRPSVETAPEAPLIEVGEIKINTIKEGKEFAIKVIEEAIGVKAKISVSSELKVENFKERINELKKLFSEYKIDNNVANEVNLIFKSKGSKLGRVVQDPENSIQGLKYKITEINLGHLNDNEAIDVKRFWVTDKGYNRETFGNKIDAKNLQIGVTTHEFAHIIANYKVARNTNNTKQLQYWKELNEIKKNYNKEVLELYKNKDIEELNKIYTGQYSNTNIDEFHAELFMEYKLNSNPSKYAILVGNLIDKNFKK